VASRHLVRCPHAPALSGARRRWVSPNPRIWRVSCHRGRVRARTPVPARRSRGSRHIGGFDAKECARRGACACESHAARDMRGPCATRGGFGPESPAPGCRRMIADAPRRPPGFTPSLPSPVTGPPPAPRAGRHQHVRRGGRRPGAANVSGVPLRRRLGRETSCREATADRPRGGAAAGGIWASVAARGARFGAEASGARRGMACNPPMRRVG
jgi:hypothetical protein